jgi:hypothetical protein
MVPISPRTASLVSALFAPKDVAAANRMLEVDCGNELPFLQDWTPESLERIRFAVLRISRGDLVRLRDAVMKARTDWRDVLVEAGFGNDPNAHTKWRPRLQE